VSHKKRDPIVRIGPLYFDILLAISVLYLTDRKSIS
jgi:hypothetical protein